MHLAKPGHFVWLRNGSFDVLFISCPIVLQIMVWLSYENGLLSPMTIFLLYSLVCDAPHVAATHAKTLVSLPERPWLSRLWVRSFALYLVGPGLLGAGAILGAPITFKLFYGFVLAWAGFHSVRQHYGIYVAYQLRLSETSTGVDNKLSYHLFHVALLVSATYYLLAGPMPRWIFAGDPLPWLRSPSVLYFTVILLGALLAYEGVALWRSRARSFPRFLLVASLTIFPAVFYLSGSLLSLGPLLVTPLFTIHHSVQYMAFTYHSMKKPVAHSRPTFSARLAGSPYFYVGFVMFLGVSVRLIEWTTTHVNPHFPKLLSNSVMAQTFDSYTLALALVLGYSLQHYVLDQYLWRKPQLLPG